MLFRKSKSASRSLNSFFWVIGVGDANIQSIAADAGITTIKYVDKEVTVWPLGVYTEEKYTVYGD